MKKKVHDAATKFQKKTALSFHENVEGFDEAWWYKKYDGLSILSHAIITLSSYPNLPQGYLDRHLPHKREEVVSETQKVSTN